MNLKSMSLVKLTKLKDQVDAILRTKVADQRRSLEAELTKLSRFSGSQLRSKVPGVRGPVAPKYRNPQNPSETWAGRGLKPRWLAAALKAGKKLEQFSIAQTAKQATKKAPRKTNGAKSDDGFSVGHWGGVPYIKVTPLDARLAHLFAT